MKTTIDPPPALVREMKLLAVHEGRKLKDVADTGAGDGNEGAGEGTGKKSGEGGGKATAVAVSANVPNSRIFRLASFRFFVPRLCRFNFPLRRETKYKFPFSCRPMFFSMIFTFSFSFLSAKGEEKVSQNETNLDTARGNSQQSRCVTH